MKPCYPSRYIKLLSAFITLATVLYPAWANAETSSAAVADIRAEQVVTADPVPAALFNAEPSVSAKIIQTQAVADKTIVTINKGSNDGVQIGDQGEVADTKVSFRITKVFKFRSTAVVDIRHEALEGRDKANIKPTGTHEPPAANG